jgi:hypothetical protein
MRGEEGEWFISTNHKHNKNQIACILKGKNLFCNKFIMGWLVKSVKLVQSTIVFHSLEHGKPTLEYEAHKDLFDFLNLEKIPKCIGQTTLNCLWFNICMALFSRPQNLQWEHPNTSHLFVMK